MKLLTTTVLILLLSYVLPAQVVELKPQQNSIIAQDYQQVTHSPVNPVPVNLPIGDIYNGDTIAVTTYDYFTNHIMRRQIAQNNGMVFFTNMIRGFSPADPSLRSVRFIRDSSGYWVQRQPFPGHTGWPSIDCNGFNTPSLTAHTPVQTAYWNDHDNNFYVHPSIDDSYYPTLVMYGPGGTNVFVGDAPPNHTDRYLYRLIGSPRLEFSLSDISPPMQYQKISTTEIGFSRSTNRNRITYFGALNMFEGQGGVEVWDGVAADSADRVFILSTDYFGYDIEDIFFYPDGDFSEMAAGFHIDNFAPLPENFGQIDVLVSDDINIHAVVNGYGGYFNDARDTLLDYAYPILYRNNNTGGWVGLSDPAIDLLPTEVMSDMRVGNSIGQGYPCMAISDDGQYLYCIWQGPQLNSSAPNGVDTENGKMMYDLYHSLSTDGGNTWNYLGVFADDPGASEMYPNVAFNLELVTGYPNRIYAHILYLNDPTNGCSVFDESPVDDAYLVYRKYALPVEINLPPSIRIVVPGSMERWVVGEVEDIVWESNDIENVKIGYTYDGGYTWHTIVESYPASAGSYPWTIPYTPSEDCKIWITSTSDYSIADVSYGEFTIYQPEVTVLSPNGGERWLMGTEQSISWDIPYGEPVRLEYSVDNGSSWETIYDSTKSHTVAWTLPNVISDECLVKITNIRHPDYFDISDTTFSIYETGVTVTSPNGGEEWCASNDEHISWISHNINDVVIEYTTDQGASWIIIDTTAAADTVYLWNPPLIDEDECKVRIRDLRNADIFDTSDHPFSIHTPYVRVLSPNGGEMWKSYSYNKIEWESIGTQYLNIYLTVDNGNTWEVVYDTVPASNMYGNFRFPNIESEECYIKIEDIAVPEITDQSDSAFTLYKPTITVDYPNGGEILEVGQQVSIIWECDDVNFVKIYLSTNGGSSFSTVSLQLDAKQQSYLWEVPSQLSEQCLIKIIDYSNPTIYDLSDSVFTIAQPMSADGFDDGKIPDEYALHQNFPNPFNPESKIYFDLPEPASVEIIIYDIRGKEISRPVDEYKPAGRYHITFDGSELPSGVYFYSIRTEKFNEVRKMLLLK